MSFYLGNVLDKYMEKFLSQLFFYFTDLPLILSGMQTCLNLQCFVTMNEFPWSNSDGLKYVRQLANNNLE